MRASTTTTRRLTGFGLAAGLLIGGAACSSTSTTAATTGTSVPGGGPSNSVTVSFSEKGCDPTAVTALAGDVTVNYKNVGSDTGEIEVISSDQRVKGEAENVAPTFAKAFTAAGLTPGTYDIICGSTKAPKGTLTVVAVGGSTGTEGPTGTAPTGTAISAGLQDALTQYKAYVHTQAVLAQTQTKKFVAAIDAGDLAGAQAMFGTIRQPYENIEPVAESFADIDAAVDARADDFDSPEDPKFTGYHRLEYGLFEKKSLDGLEPIAHQLQTDIDKLVEKTVDLDITASDMVNGSKELLEEVSASKITGEEDRYSGTDLFDFRANLDGSQKVFVLVKPLVSEKDAALADKIAKGFDDVDKTLTTYENADGTYKLYTSLTEQDKKSMSAQIAQLSEDLAQLPGVLGLPTPAPPAPEVTTTTSTTTTR